MAVITGHVAGKRRTLRVFELRFGIIGPACFCDVSPDD